MIYKFISLKNIVEGLYRDYEYNESLDIDDLAEWAGEALRLINAPQQLKYQIAELNITNYKDFLPCNFHSIEQVYFNGYPLHYNTGTFPTITSDISPGSTPLYNKPVSQGISGADIIIDDLTALGYDVSDELSNLLKGTFTRYSSTTYNADYYYEIADNQIYTSFEEGDIMLIYRGIPVDTEGYPMIPDNVYYEKAIKAYLQYMLDRRDWRAVRISDKVYAESKAEWKKYVRGAKAAALTPTLDQLENLKKQWVRIIPNTTTNSTFYTNLDKEEIFIR